LGTFGISSMGFEIVIPGMCYYIDEGTDLKYK